MSAIHSLKWGIRDIFQLFDHLYESSIGMGTYPLWSTAFSLNVSETQDWAQMAADIWSPDPTGTGCFLWALRALSIVPDTRHWLCILGKVISVSEVWLLNPFLNSEMGISLCMYQENIDDSRWILHKSGCYYLPIYLPGKNEKWKWSRSVVSDSCDPMDCSLQGSSVHGILQARVLELILLTW